MSQELSRLDILKLFKTNLIKFLDALIEQFPSEGDLAVLRVFLSEQIPIEDVLIVFSKRLLPYKQMILNKDEKFFIEGDDVFKGVSSDTVSYCKNIWLSEKITGEDKEQIWKWFKLFVNLSEKYINLK
jgi:hypothetical protein